MCIRNRIRCENRMLYITTRAECLWQCATMIKMAIWLAECKSLFSFHCSYFVFGNNKNSLRLKSAVAESHSFILQPSDYLLFSLQNMCKRLLTMIRANGATKIIFVFFWKDRHRIWAEKGKTIRFAEYWLLLRRNFVFAFFVSCYHITI